MSTQFQQFKALHFSDGPFVLPNSWDAASALMFEKCGYPAIGTSSAAVAESLGYADGEEIPFSDYLRVIQRIVGSVHLPTTIDIEMGFGRTKEHILKNVEQLVDIGVAGINIEDSVIELGNRSLNDPGVFAENLAFIKQGLIASGRELFINVRCDTFLLNVPAREQETEKRMRLYEKAGADGIFLPAICNEADIQRAISQTKLPLNVMCIPGLPAHSVLTALGVKRISMGPFFFQKIYEPIKELGERILRDNDYSIIIN